MSATGTLLAIDQGTTSTRAILFDEQPNLHLLAPAAVTCMVVMVVGYIVFRRTEIGIADVA